MLLKISLNINWFSLSLWRGIKFYGRRFCPMELSFRRLKTILISWCFSHSHPGTDFCSLDVISWDGLTYFRAVQALTCNIWIGVWLVMERSGHGMILGIDFGVWVCHGSAPWLTGTFPSSGRRLHEWICLSVRSLSLYPPVLMSICVCCPIQAVGVQRRRGMLSAGKDLPTWNSKFPVQGRSRYGSTEERMGWREVFMKASWRGWHLEQLCRDSCGLMAQGQTEPAPLVWSHPWD